MCDTAGKIVSDRLAVFAKNSDRSPNEAQVNEYIRHKTHDEKKLKCTYIEIDQVKETNAMILSRPIWLWGGEMGVNEYGVCIGNEAVFTKGKYGEASLIGMDLLRLGLERGNSAKEALEVIISLLERYGQGGNCGYDKEFHYDNSFLIMDREEIYVLETAGKNWVYKKSNGASISNRLILREDGDVYSGKRCDFKKTYSDLLYSTFSSASHRRSCTCDHKLDCVEDGLALLRQHSVADPMARGSVSSVCMHAGNLFADQTTASMVVELKKDDIAVFTTGSSRPCLSIFKPYRFETCGIIYPENEATAGDYWRKMEKRQRRMLGKKIPEDYYREKAEWERKILNDPEADMLALEEEFYTKWDHYEFEDTTCAVGFKNYWKKKNNAFYQNEIRS